MKVCPKWDRFSPQTRDFVKFFLGLLFFIESVLYTWGKITHVVSLCLHVCLSLVKLLGGGGRRGKWHFQYYPFHLFQLPLWIFLFFFRKKESGERFYKTDRKESWTDWGEGNQIFQFFSYSTFTCPRVWVSMNTENVAQAFRSLRSTDTVSFRAKMKKLPKKKLLDHKHIVTRNIIHLEIP